MLSRLKIWARRLSRDGHAIYLASRDPRVPWYVKFLAIAVAGYALSPIDLIPDFIPVVGYLDDLIIGPLGIWLVVSLIPEQPEALGLLALMLYAESRRGATMLAPAVTGGVPAENDPLNPGRFFKLAKSCITPSF